MSEIKTNSTIYRLTPVKIIAPIKRPQRVSGISKIEVGAKTYDYLAWKIGKDGLVSYSSREIKALEEKLIKYLYGSL